jgi:hypothetical protein
VEDRDLEFQKLIFEFFKQIANVSAAAAVVVPTVSVALDLPFVPPVTAMGFFALSVFVSGMGMFMTAGCVKDGDGSAPSWLLIVACVFIFAGLATISYIAIVERPSASEIPPLGIASYSPNLVEGVFCELRFDGVLRSSLRTSNIKQRQKYAV